MTEIEKRLDEAAKAIQAPFLPDSYEADVSVYAFKLDARYGIEWVIEETSKYSDWEYEFFKRIGRLPISSDWVRHLRENFAPILERGRG